MHPHYRPRGRPRLPIETRFWARVIQDGPVPPHCPEIGPCWTWTGGFHAQGYGTIRRHGRQSPILAHRCSWELHHGPIPAGMYCLHQCDNPGCINPAHLFLGTHADNMRDKVQKDRAPHGEQTPSAKLTEAHVQAIRAAHATTTLSALGRQYGVDMTTIRAIRRGETWKHVR